MVDLIEKRPEKNIGFEDPELLHYISTLYELFPNAKYVFLERDRKECEISLSRWIHPNIMDSIEPKFDRWYEDIDKMNRLIQDVKKINFYDMNEIDEIKSKGVKVSPENLIISESANLILPFHKEMDEIREDAAGNAKIGTTRRGIGPAYEDKVGRRSISCLLYTSPSPRD